MKRRISLALHIAAIAVLLIGVMLLLQDAGDVLREKPYEAGAPTKEKFAMAKRWLPPDEDFLIAVDAPRFMANPLLAERLGRIARGGRGVAAQLTGALMEDEDALGLLVLAGKINEPGVGPQVVILAQGSFDEEKIVPAVRSAMSEGKSGVAAQDLGWSTLYSESDSRDPFGFMILDKNHMAVGERSSLLAFYENAPAAEEKERGPADGAVFGYVSIGKRFKGAAPKMIYIPEAAYISSDDGLELSVRMPCRDAERAGGIASFLEGLRSLMTIQQGPDSAGGLAGMIKDVSIESEGGDVVLKAMLLPILDLWIEDPEGVKSELSRAQDAPQGQTPLSDQPARTAP